MKLGFANMKFYFDSNDCKFLYNLNAPSTHTGSLYVTVTSDQCSVTI